MNNDTHTHSADASGDDPRLTAYALGEITGEDAASFEQRLGTDAALRHEIDAIRSTASALRKGFASEPSATLTASQRAAILRQPMRQEIQSTALNSPRVFALRSRWIGATLAAAAVIGIVATAAIMFNNGRVDNEFARSQVSSPQTSPPAVASREGFMGGSGGAGRSNDAASSANRDRSLAMRRGAGTGAPGDRGELKDDLTAAVDPSATGARSADGSAPAPMSALDQQTPKEIKNEPRPLSEVAPGAAPPPAPSGGGAASPAGNASGESGNARTRPAGDGAKPAAPSSAQPPAPPPMPVVPSSAKSTEQSPAVQPTPAPSIITPTSGATRQGDADAGGLRQPFTDKSAAGDVDARDAQPAVPLLSDEEISKLSEAQVEEALRSTDESREAARDQRTQAQLKKQTSELMSRLRVLRQAQAEEYSRINDNPFIRPVGVDALSTFAADVDTASYSNLRRFLDDGQLPPPDAVRIEEMINYFRYDYAPPSAEDGDVPFKANVEVAAAPWNPKHRLVRIGLRGKEEPLDMRRPTSLVFLVDVSGSMNEQNKLPLVKQALSMLVEQLNADDRLAIVTYAGNAGLVLDSCYVTADNREKVDTAIETMQPGGSTNGAGGINLAYDVARQHFIKDGINRVILCTDGDFNVGVSGDDALVQLIEEQRKSNVFLTVLGFGTGNLKDSKMQALADAGNGNFAYIDSEKEARRVLVEQMGGTLVTIAKDVKFQIEFNPAKVGAYRLIGYENRLLAAEDFNNDLKDAGEIGSGHSMTALYEIVPVGAEAQALALNEPRGELDELKYQKPANDAAAAKPADSEELLELKIRYKKPDADASEATIRIPVVDAGKSIDQASADFRFASAVAEFGLLLRRSPYRGGATLDHVLFQAEGSLGEDSQGYRAQFMELVRKAQAIEKGS